MSIYKMRLINKKKSTYDTGTQVAISSAIVQQFPVELFIFIKITF
jgi:hypothetical protein